MQRKIKVAEINEVLGTDRPFDSIIDVRSPSEFAEDHLPGSINLPVLTDLERSEVGTLYKQVDPLLHEKGAVLTSLNIAKHLEVFIEKIKGLETIGLLLAWRTTFHIHGPRYARNRLASDITSRRLQSLP